MTALTRLASFAVLGSAALLAGLTTPKLTVAGDENWPQWRGPLRTGAAPEANPPVEWSESKNVKWKVKIPGSGTATPIIWENKVFVQTAIPTGKKPAVAAAQPDSAPPAPAAASSGQGSSFTSRLLDSFDTNKDGKISRKEVPEARRGVFDRMIEQHKLDPEKTYSREELDKLLGSSTTPAKTESSSSPPQQQQRPRPGGGGGMRGAKPTEPYQFVLMCLDRQTGKTLWQQVAREEIPHEGTHPDHGFSSHSPVTDGVHVFAYFGSRGLHCFDMQGKLKWSQDFGDMRIQNGFGEGSSPTLHGNAVIVTWDNEGDSFIIALNKNTGETLWKKPRDEKTSWSTPLVVEHDGKSQVVTTASRKIRSYDLASGDLIWECSGLTRNVIPTPVAADGTVYATSGFQGNALLAIRLGRTGDLTGTDAILWSARKGTPYVPSPLLYGGRLYLFASNNNILSCFDIKTGQPVIDGQRLNDLQGVYASPVGASGRVYLVGRNGATVVIKQSEKLEVLATNRLDDRLDASPAIAGNELYLRGHEYLYCIAEK